MRKKILGKLSKGQLDLYLRQAMCKKATADLIREIVHEREKAEVYLSRIWSKIDKEYCNGLTAQELTQVTLDENTGEVFYMEDRTGEVLAKETLELKKLDIEWAHKE